MRSRRGNAELIIPESRISRESSPSWSNTEHKAPVAFIRCLSIFRRQRGHFTSIEPSAEVVMTVSGGPSITEIRSRRADRGPTYPIFKVLSLAGPADISLALIYICGGDNSGQSSTWPSGMRAGAAGRQEYGRHINVGV